MKYLLPLVALGGIGVGIGWFLHSLRRLSCFKTNVYRAQQQLAMYRQLASQCQNGEEEALHREQVEISQEIYKNARMAYALSMQRPENRIFALLLHDRTTGEGEKP